MAACSLIIAFYNRIDFLRLVFASLERQTFQEFEVIIADDGSSNDVMQSTKALQSSVSFPSKHVWHEDRGFRKNKILNKAILAAQSPYLIFIDGDCILHRNFIREHYLHRCEKVCLTGRRVNLSQKLSASLTPEKVRNGYLESNAWKLFADSVWGNSTFVEKGWYFSNSFLRKIVNFKQRGLLGCNFSLYKRDVLAINGFDERYELPSMGEDTDLEYRLRLSDVTIRSLNNIAVQYHLFHHQQPRLRKNIELYNKIHGSGTAYTAFGIIKS